MCTSGDPQDLAVTDNIAASVLEEIGAIVTDLIRQQYNDNIRWIREAGKHKMVSLCKITPHQGYRFDLESGGAEGHIIH